MSLLTQLTALYFFATPEHIIAYWHQINKSFLYQVHQEINTISYMIMAQGLYWMVQSALASLLKFKLRSRCWCCVDLGNWDSCLFYNLGNCIVIGLCEMYITTMNSQGVIFLPIAIEGSICTWALYFIQQWRNARKFVFWQPLLVDATLSRSLQRAIDADREKGSDDCS
jgi:hypothetical protein